MAEIFPYEDILYVARHVSQKYPEPTMTERAARFHPFAAITDYEEMVLEEARTTEARIELDETALAMLNAKLNLLRAFLEDAPTITVTYFEPDKRKSGGAYILATGPLKRIDEYEQTLLMGEDKRIPIGDIYSLESDLFLGLCTED